MNGFRASALKVVSVLIGLLAAAILAEILLAVVAASRSSDEVMAPGLIRYHPTLGWSLSPGWRGEHEHADYRARYAINALGFRGPMPQLDNIDSVFLGDSYTFGLGVDDPETFVAILNQRCEGDVLNAAIPGYSPEQTFLQLPTVDRYGASQLFWVVYLGNDLVDIGLPVAVQAAYAKPHLVASGEGGWRMSETPVARSIDGFARPGRAEVVLGEAPGWWSSRQIVQLLSEVIPPGDPTAVMMRQLDSRVQMFEHLVGAVADRSITWVLLRGPGYYQPASLSGRYQALVRETLKEMLVNQSVIDLSGDLSADVYYPIDGHLTPQGHEIAADALSMAACPAGL